MNYPIRLASQLTQHLRALRKIRGLTQAQLGALVGVKQARIGEIEADPGVVSLNQLTRILAALGGTLNLHVTDATISADPTQPTRASQRGDTQVCANAVAAPEPVARSRVLIPPHKGSW